MTCLVSDYLMKEFGIAGTDWIEVPRQAAELIGTSAGLK